MEQIEKTNIADVVLSTDGLEPETALAIKNAFNPFIEELNKWKERAYSLKVTSVEQKDLMKLAKDGRIALRSVRTDADKKRKELKADALKYGNAVQAVYNSIESAILPIEDYLREQEEFEKRIIEAEKAKKKAERELIALPYAEFIPSIVDFAEMNDADFDILIGGAKLQAEAKAKANEERLAQEAEEAKKRELFSTRKNEASPLMDFIYDFMGIHWGELTDDEFATIIAEARAKKKAKEAEYEAQRIEAERLRKEAEERRKAEEQAAAKAAQEKREKLRNMAGILKTKNWTATGADSYSNGHFTVMLEANLGMALDVFEKLISDFDKMAKEKMEAEAKAEADRVEKMRLEAELRAKEEQERKRIEVETKAKEAEEKKRKAEEKKAKAAPDKSKLMRFSDTIEKAMLSEDIYMESLDTEEAKAIYWTYRIELMDLLANLRNEVETI